MNPLKEELLHLLTMTRSYISSEIDSNACIWLAPEVTTFYKDMAQTSKPQNNPVRQTVPISSPPVAARPLKTTVQVVKKESETIIEPVSKDPEQNRSESAPSKSVEKVSTGFILEPWQDQGQRDYSDAKKIVQERFPRLSILPLPSFETLTSLAGNRALIVHNEKNPAHVTLLKNIVKALVVHGCPAQLIAITDFESAQLPEELKLIIATTDNAEKIKLKGPALSLLPLEKYLENAQLKRELWSQLRQQLLS